MEYLTPAISTTLGQLAEGELARMRAVPWHSYATLIHETSSGSGGETYGCEVDGRYYDVGVSVAWVAKPDGDIRLIAHATTYFGSEGKPTTVGLHTILHPD